MKRMLVGLACLVAGLAFLLIAAFAWGRLRPPTEEQARALFTLHVDLKPKQGSNAFPLQWFTNFDVPYDQLDSLYAKDSEHARAWVVSLPKNDILSVPAPTASPPFPALEPLGKDKNVLCATREVDCLGKVRANREALRAVLIKHRVRLERDEALNRYDYTWSDLPAHPLMSIPAYGHSMGLWSSAAALDFVDGNEPHALDRICTNVLTTRRLHAHSNTLIGTMIMAARLRSATQLFLQMLDEVPPEQALPESCATAFAPIITDDLDMCASMQSEFGMLLGSGLLDMDTPWYRRWMLSSKGTLRLGAPAYAAYCADATRKQLIADRRFPANPMSTAPDVFDWISNSAGSVLIQMPPPVFSRYLNRQQDAAASLRLGATILWLRETRADGRTLSERLAQRPDWMHVADDRALRLSPDNRSLLMGSHDEDSDWHERWPLPKGI
ncbi:hypothetical protein EC912_10871 [Luteibacter rhizovicinus]|uniref:Uncharacterized protein n=1 Tax=Luteibacter rhizovicinus TaxID=242606 RepID=A0A4V6P424_9GAMM|nr:hypothetical protein [Luteibacter rhizovicinus]TCV92079.1 hypothetical protein EC912_10871 [Luteibacter rhizovicinus]